MGREIHKVQPIVIQRIQHTRGGKVLNSRDRATFQTTRVPRQREGCLGHTFLTRSSRRLVEVNGGDHLVG